MWQVSFGIGNRESVWSHEGGSNKLEQAIWMLTPLRLWGKKSLARTDSFFFFFLFLPHTGFGVWELQHENLFDNLNFALELGVLASAHQDSYFWIFDEVHKGWFVYLILVGEQKKWQEWEHFGEE